MHYFLGLNGPQSLYSCIYGFCYKTNDFGPIEDGKERKPVGRGGRWLTREARTTRKCQKYYEEWMAKTGGDEKKLKDYYGCKYPALEIYGEDRQDVDWLIDFPPMCLHLLLGKLF